MERALTFVWSTFVADHCVEWINRALDAPDTVTDEWKQEFQENMKHTFSDEQALSNLMDNGQTFS